MDKDIIFKGWILQRKSKHTITKNLHNFFSLIAPHGTFSKDSISYVSEFKGKNDRRLIFHFYVPSIFKIMDYWLQVTVILGDPDSVFWQTQCCLIHAGLPYATLLQTKAIFYVYSLTDFKFSFYSSISNTTVWKRMVRDVKREMETPS